MKKLLVLCLLVAACSPVKVLKVEDDYGGLIDPYAENLQTYDRFEISGDCASSCVVYALHEGACVHPGARLGAHWWRSRGVLDEGNTRLILSLMPKSLQEVWTIESLPKDERLVLWVPGEDHLPLC